MKMKLVKFFKLVILILLLISIQLPWTVKFSHKVKPYLMAVPVKWFSVIDLEVPIFSGWTLYLALSSLICYGISLTTCILSTFKLNYKILLLSGISAILSSILWFTGIVKSSYGVTIFINPAPDYEGPLNISYLEYEPGLGPIVLFITGIISLVYSIALKMLSISSKDKISGG